MKTNQLPPLPEPHCDAHEDAGFYYPDMFTGNQMRSYALQARAQVQGEVCPTCGETEPYTGSCGTSNNDTKALCKKPVQAQSKTTRYDARYGLLQEIKRIEP